MLISQLLEGITVDTLSNGAKIYKSPSSQTIRTLLYGDNSYNRDPYTRGLRFVVFDDGSMYVAQAKDAIHSNMIEYGVYFDKKRPLFCGFFLISKDDKIVSFIYDDRYLLRMSGDRELKQKLVAKITKRYPQIYKKETEEYAYVF